MIGVFEHLLSRIYGLPPEQISTFLLGFWGITIGCITLILVSLFMLMSRRRK